MHLNVDTHLKRTRQKEQQKKKKKKVVWKESEASNERECQQRSRAPSLCLSPSQDRLENLDRRERGERERSDLTANDAKPLFKAFPAAQASHWHIYLLAASLISSQRTPKTGLLFAFPVPHVILSSQLQQSWWMGWRGGGGIILILKVKTHFGAYFWDRLVEDVCSEPCQCTFVYFLLFDG